MRDFDRSLDQFLVACQAIIDREVNDPLQRTDIIELRATPEIFADAGPRYTLEIDPGRRYVRIWLVCHGRHTSRSAWAFVDRTSGDVLKPASWRGPAKHARGNIYADDPTERIRWTGPEYLR